MIKKLFILLASGLISFQSIGQSTFNEGDNVLGIGIGLGGVYGFSGYNSQTPAFGIHYDHGFRELNMGAVIGLGGYLGYKSYAYDIGINNNNYYDKWSITILGARGTFHYDLFKVQNLDTYGGLMLAFHIVNNSNNLPNGYAYNRNYSSALYASLLAGAKYHFTDSFAGFLEAGYGVSWLTVGGAFKF